MPENGPIESLFVALRDAYPELDAVREAADRPVYLVGGAVRDMLLGGHRSANLDLVVEGDAIALAARLGTEVLEHERFATATIGLADLEIDIATARSESYPEPGALPDIVPVADIETDLARRDFTINAMAVPLAEARLIDPWGGRADLEAARLRVLHERSFIDDPTRALRAARYAARLEFTLEPGTESLLRETDLATISAQRREAELLRLAAEPRALDGFELLIQWGLIEPRPAGIELAGRVCELLETPPWAGVSGRDRAILAAVCGSSAEEPGPGEPQSPSAGVALAASQEPEELLLARAAGATWLDRYLSEWRDVVLEIDGSDLLAAGVVEGPAIGRGLAAALRMKLDGELSPGRSAELAAALGAAREEDGLD